jgi:hypothetical protein
MLVQIEMEQVSMNELSDETLEGMDTTAAATYYCPMPSTGIPTAC